MARDNSAMAQVQAIVDEVLLFARKMLLEHGEFFPFGAFMKPDGSIAHVGALDSTTDRPRSEVLIEILKKEFRERAKHHEIRACAIVLDVRIVPPDGAAKTDAIQVNIEHIDSYCAEVFFPYHFAAEGTLEFGVAFAQRGVHTLFAD